jgi:hypothetical protein
LTEGEAEGDFSSPFMGHRSRKINREQIRVIRESVLEREKLRDILCSIEKPPGHVDV